MRRTTVATSLAAMVAALFVPLAPTAFAAPGEGIPPASGSSQVVLGDGDGLSGPASRARIDSPGHLTLASNGTVLAVSGLSLLRVDPASDSVSVVESYDETQEHGAIDVALLGSTTFLLTPWGLDRIEAGGARTRLWTGQGNAVDVGADGVAWVTRSHGVIRVLPDGTAAAVTGTEVMTPADIAVDDSGSTAYVLDHASQRYGIYEVTAAGVGARVAGTGYRDDSLREGQLATAASMEAVGGLSIEGSTITVVSLEYRLIASFPIGGSVSVRSTGGYGGAVDSAGGTTVATTYGYPGSVVRHTSSGTTRILGVDPARQWSPDGVLASDAYTGPLRGAAAVDDTRLVFVTAAGMVREVQADGRLHTRATLPPITTRGKVAVGPDATAYVVDDAGRVVRVPVSGPPQTLPISATATDVEVLPDGRIVVADSATSSVLVASADGTGVAVLGSLASAPTDLGLDGGSVLVADDGLRRVSLDGTISTILHGGHPTAALRGKDGLWVGKLHSPDTTAMVLHPGGGLGALRAVFSTGNQAQADAAGNVLVTQDDTVLRVTDGAAVPERTGPDVIATAGEGRVILTTADGNPTEGIVRAKRGTQPPSDPWDGEAVGPSNTVFRVGSALITPGEQWTFAVFTAFLSSTGQNVSVTSYTTSASATAAADPDTTPPPPPAQPAISADHAEVWVSYLAPSPFLDPAASDFDRSVVRYALGSTPPATPADGVELDAGSGSGYHAVSVPDPVRGQDYAISVFTLDLRGNFSRWSAVTRLDFQPPGAVTDVSVTPSYRSARVQFTSPTDPDYEGAAYAFAEGDVAPTLPSDVHFFASPPVFLDGLTMDTTYTVAVWTRDRAGNVSEVVTRTFRTLLDLTPPGPVTGLTAEGGNYTITARWTNPTDADFSQAAPELVDPATGTATRCGILGVGGTSCTWRIKGDATRVVRVRARDVNGNLSDPAEATATSWPDSNGTPSIGDPVTWSATNPTTISVRFPKPTASDLAALSYVLRPSGQPTAPPVGSGSVTWSVGLTTVAQSISLPDAAGTYDLYLYAYDLNGNRGEKVLTGVHGGPDPAGRPSMPGSVAVTAPFDNTIKVTWIRSAWSAPVTEWVATATSADGTVRTVRVPGTATNLGIGDLAGRQQWTVRLYGVNDVGSGASSLPQIVQVGDTTAPAPVTSLVSAPAYDTATLRWANPSPFDFAKVVVVRRDRTTGAVTNIYTGTGTNAPVGVLVAGRSYTYEVRSYDTLGNVSLPATLTTTQSVAALSVASSARYGSAVRASGVLSSSGRGLGGRRVTLFAQRVGTTSWSAVVATTSSSTGVFAFSVKPTVNMRYRVGYAGAATVGGTYSAARVVTVLPVLSIKASRTSLYRGSSLTLSTAVAPNHARYLVSLQRWSGTRWVTITSRALTRTSVAAAVVRPTARGYNYYRWYLPAHSDHGGNVSATLRVRVY